mgnify:CR=1 FL=1
MKETGWGIAFIPVIPMRSDASEKSEMTTQMLFGDHFEIIESTEKCHLFAQDQIFMPVGSIKK